MSNITEQEIEKLSLEKYPIKERAKHLDPYDENQYDRNIWVQGYKSALQNKVSDVSAADILYNRLVAFKEVEDKNDECFFPYKSSEEMVKQESICKVFIGAMKEYASIVNERKVGAEEDWIKVYSDLLIEKQDFSKAIIELVKQVKISI